MQQQQQQQQQHATPTEGKQLLWAKSQDVDCERHSFELFLALAASAITGLPQQP